MALSPEGLQAEVTAALQEDGTSATLIQTMQGQYDADELKAGPEGRTEYPCSVIFRTGRRKRMVDGSPVYETVEEAVISAEGLPAQVPDVTKEEPGMGWSLLLPNGREVALQEVQMVAPHGEVPVALFATVRS